MSHHVPSSTKRGVESLTRLSRRGRSFLHPALRPESADHPFACIQGIARLAAFGRGAVASAAGPETKDSAGARLDDLDGEVGVAARAVGPWAPLAAKAESCARLDTGRDGDLNVLGVGSRVEGDPPLAA